MNPVSISVCISAYTERRWADLERVVASLQRQTFAPYEVIVVVDHNAALLERALAHLSDVVVIANDGPRGLSGARNSGLRAAGGAIVAFLDDDAVAADDWLERLARGYAEPNVAGVGGSIVPSWDSGRPGWFPDEMDWVVGCTYRGMPERPQPVRNLIGCNMSFRADLLEALGGFRDGIGRVGTLPVGCEETELCIRLSQHWPDLVLLYDPAARVEHRVPAERARWRYYASRCFAEGRSKALVARFVGAGDGLSNERTYTFKTLPRGAARDLGETFTRRDPWGPLRATAIATGLAVTTAGYLDGVLRAGRTGTSGTSGSLTHLAARATVGEHAGADVVAGGKGIV